MTKQHFEWLSLKGGSTGSSESILVKTSHCWKSHVTAHLLCFRFGGRKPKTMMSMVEGEYLDPSMTTTENEVGFLQSKGDNLNNLNAIYVCVVVKGK